MKHKLDCLGDTIKHKEESWRGEERLRQQEAESYVVSMIQRLRARHHQEIDSVTAQSEHVDMKLKEADKRKEEVMAELQLAEQQVNVLEKEAEQLKQQIINNEETFQLKMQQEANGGE